ncbi:MAG TPA: hypothetical protein VFD82_01935 [Planctomycetota bacterium]|nr:hypothetical protein [Planctomycetota bacterium]
MTAADQTDAVHPDPVDPHADDWAPLPEEKRILHPGELIDDAAHPPAAPAPALPSVETQEAPVAEADPAAEQALRDLKAQIAAHAPATSLVAEVVHREEKKERQQRAVSAVRAADAAIMKGGKQPRDPLPIEYDAGAHGRDQREEDAWFKALPAEERNRLHAAWAQKRQQVLTNIANHRRNGNRRLAAALFVFAVVALAGTRVMWAATAGAGICCGIWWRQAVPDRIRDPLRAVGCLLGMHAVGMLVYGFFDAAVFIDAVVVVGLATLVGFDGEMRRAGGFDTH